MTDDPGFRPETHSTVEGPAPGEECIVCKRRVPYPRKQDSPVSKSIAYRVPLDEIEAHENVAESAARFIGVHERPHWRYLLNTYAYALVLQDESMKGIAQKGTA